MFQLNQTYSTKEFDKELQISMDTWKRKESRERYLEYLEDFIAYTITTKGRSNFYTITAIYEDYVKPNFKKKTTIKSDVAKHFDEIWQVGEPETCSRVAAKLIKMELVDSTSQKGVSNKVSEYRNEKYGKPGTSGGSNGKCYYIRAKMWRNQPYPTERDKNGNPCWDLSLYTYELLTSEDKKELCRIHDKWYPDDIMKIDTLREKLQKNEINSIDQVADCILERDLTQSERSDKFMQYTAELAQAFGCDWVVRATYVDENIIPCEEVFEF